MTPAPATRYWPAVWCAVISYSSLGASTASGSSWPATTCTTVQCRLSCKSYHLPALVEGVEGGLCEGLRNDVAVQVVEADVGQDGAAHLAVEPLHLQTSVRRCVNLARETKVLDREQPQHLKQVQFCTKVAEHFWVCKTFESIIQVSFQT